jgi:nucleoside transporter
MVIRPLHARLALMMFLQFFVLGSWLVTTGTYLLETLAFTGNQVGLVYAGTAIGAIVSPFISGLIADRYVALEKFMAILHGLSAITMFILAQVVTFSWFYPLVIVYLVLHMPTMGLSTAMCFHHIEDPNTHFPRVRAWGTLGFVVAGLFVGSLGLEQVVTPLYISATASVIYALYCLTLPHTPPSEEAKQRSVAQLIGLEAFGLLKRRSFAILMLALTLICVPSAFYYSFVNPYLNEIGIQNAAGKMTMGQMSEIFFLLTLPFFLRRMRLRYVMFIGLLAWGIRYLLFGYGQFEGQGWMLYAGILLHGIAFCFTALTGQIYVDRVAPKHLRSTAQGFVSFITLGFGAFFGSWLAGWIVDAHTLTSGQHEWLAIWSIPAWVGIGTALLFLLMFRRKMEAEA